MVIFLFLGNLRSTLIPIVTIPLSLIGVMLVLLALGYSINLLTLLALVLAIGLVVDDAIVVVENIHRHIEEGMTPLRCGAEGRARDHRSGHRHDHHAGGGLCADRLRVGPDRRPVPRIRLHAGRRGDRVRHHRADAVADDVLEAAAGEHAGGGGFDRFLDRRFEGLKQRYQRRLHAPSTTVRSPSWCWPASSPHRPHVYDHPARARAGGGSGHPVHPGQDAAIRQSRLSRGRHQQLYEVYSTVPEKEHVFTINGMGSVHQGFSGILFKPWGERNAIRSSSAELQPQSRSIADGTGDLVLAALVAGHRPAEPPVQFVITHHARLQQLADVLAEVRQKPTKSGMFIFTDWT